MYGSPSTPATPVAKTIHRDEYRQLIDLLREHRESMGVSQGAVARKVGWTQQKLSYIETGARRMDVLEFIALARALGLSPIGAFRHAERVALGKRKSATAKSTSKRAV